MGWLYTWIFYRRWSGSGVNEVRWRGHARGVQAEGENDGRERTRIYACKPERPLYVVDAVIYDTYRSQLRVMALTLVFMAILFLVAFHGRRRLYPLPILFVRDFGPYAKQPVILVWFTFPSTPKLCSERPQRTSNPAGKVITLNWTISLLWPFFLTSRTVAKLTRSQIRAQRLFYQTSFFLYSEFIFISSLRTRRILQRVIFLTPVCLI